MEYRKAAEELYEIRLHDARKAAQLDAVVVRGEANVLLFLANHEGRCLAGDIARGLGLSASRATIILNSLKKKGLIAKERDEMDKRKVYISLTKEGDEEVLRRREEVIVKFEEMFRELGQKDTEEYIRIMRRLFEIMEKK